MPCPCRADATATATEGTRTLRLPSSEMREAADQRVHSRPSSSCSNVTSRSFLSRCEPSSRGNKSGEHMVLSFTSLTTCHHRPSKGGLS
ncbi:hypothetical protein D3C72_2297450 [compost metagenome]